MTRENKKSYEHRLALLKELSRDRRSALDKNDPSLAEEIRKAITSLQADLRYDGCPNRSIEDSTYLRESAPEMNRISGLVDTLREYTPNDMLRQELMNRNHLLGLIPRDNTFNARIDVPYRIPQHAIQIIEENAVRIQDQTDAIRYNLAAMGENQLRVTWDEVLTPQVELRV